MNEDSHAIGAISERLSHLEDNLDALGVDVYGDIDDLTADVNELKKNMASVISMFTQMNISLLQIQSEVLGREEN